jgi:signal transduction histidine kinase
MGSFLGVPVRVRGTIFGNLYLTEKIGGSEFTEVDEELVVALAGVAGLLIENARAYGVSERRRAWLEAAATLPDALQASADREECLTRIAVTARRAGGARAVAIVDARAERVLAVSCGPDDEEEIRLRLDTVMAQVAQMEILDPVDVTGGGLVGTVVPLPTQLTRGGLLVALHDLAEARYRDVDDRELLLGFTHHAALTLDRSQAISERAELAVVSDRERIARDLHDVVIQRLFATGMQLRAAAKHATSDDVRDQVERSVGELDTTIRDVRATIFELQAPSAGSVRGEVRALAREYHHVLGQAPRLRIRGPIDTAVTETMREPLLKVLREALSNVARHARASTVDVVLSVADGAVTLCVDDDGVGFAAGARHSGLDNVRSRAESLAGGLELGDSPLGGARLVWWVPLTR